jgi:integrase
MVKGVRTVDATKTGRSRLVAIDAKTMNGLRAHKARQNTERLGSAQWQDSNHVFCRPDGSGLRPDYTYKQLLRLIKLSGVRRIRLHDLRHTHVTWLLEAGEHLYVVAERLGHTDPQTTSRTYAHVTPNQRSSVANVYARVRDGIQ